ncbi:MAG: hypothetical protein JSV88_33905 [Candidatus Aminicenantes bacterium]|nr:MAG: hypothetical protein JSV88_33905 [Candidatus Aminicenantes bacterium]
MEALREIILGSKLAEVIDLPEEFKASELEVIILPVKNKEKPAEKAQTINLEDLPRHKMGRELSPVDRDHIYINER